MGPLDDGSIVLTPDQALDLLDGVCAQVQLPRAETHRLEQATAIIRAALAEPGALPE